MKGMIARARAICGDVASQGFDRGLRRPLRRRLRKLWRRQRYLAFAKSLEEAEAKADHDDVLFREAGVDDVAEIARQFREQLGPDAQAVLRDQLRLGSRGVLGLSAEDGRTIVYISWVFPRDKLLMTFLSGRVGSDQTCHRRVWVPPSFRGRGLAARGLEFVECVLFTGGIRRAWAFAEAANVAARRLYRKLQYEECGWLETGTRLGRSVARAKRSGNSRWVGLPTQYLTEAPSTRR